MALPGRKKKGGTEVKLVLNFAHPENKANSCMPGTRAAAVKANYVRMATKKKERNAGYIAALGAVRDLPPVDGKVQEFKPLWYRIVWYYKGVKPDADNIVARCKHVLDGCAFGFGVNDATWEFVGVQRVHDKARGGEVEIIFSDEL